MSVLLLVDAHAVIYRAYHAIAPLTTSEGTLVNAVYGFSRIVLKALRDLHPQYVAVCFDHPQPTFRHTEYLGYKADRPSMPDELRPQIQLVKDVVDALNMPRFELAGYEADDLIGTLAEQSGDVKPEPPKVIILTGDRDAFQLVTDRVHVFMPGGKWAEDKEYGPDEVKERLGVRPEEVVDLKALMGDASDAIPGVKGIGEKTAVKLIEQFHSVDELYGWVASTAAAEEAGEKGDTERPEWMKPSLIKKLAEGHEMAQLSKKLATIDRHSPITLELDSCTLAAYDKDKITELFLTLQFKSLIQQLPADSFELDVQSSLF
jgi:DNA polymerase I